MNRNLNFKGQTLMELVIGLGLIGMVITALAITTTYSLRNSQFSKNQVRATKYAQENLEKVRTIKSENLGVCRRDESINSCSSWENIWVIPFNTQQLGCSTCQFVLINSCTVDGEAKNLCLLHSADRGTLEEGFTYQIFLEDESNPALPNPQKKVTSRVYWTDTTGEHSSDLVTVFSKI